MALADSFAVQKLCYYNFQQLRLSSLRCAHEVEKKRFDIGSSNSCELGEAALPCFFSFGILKPLFSFLLCDSDDCWLRFQGWIEQKFSPPYSCGPNSWRQRHEGDNRPFRSKILTSSSWPYPQKTPDLDFMSDLNESSSEVSTWWGGDDNSNWSPVLLDVRKDLPPPPPPSTNESILSGRGRRLGQSQFVIWYLKVTPPPPPPHLGNEREGWKVTWCMAGPISTRLSSGKIVCSYFPGSSFF